VKSGGNGAAFTQLWHWLEKKGKMSLPQPSTLREACERTAKKVREGNVVKTRSLCGFQDTKE